MIAAARRTISLPRPTVLWLIAGAWTLALATHLTGVAHALHHDKLIEGGTALPAALGLFVVAWQVHVAAMMLPSSLPMIRLFNRASEQQPRADAVRIAFLGGYIAVWTVFGILAFVGDIGIHRAVDAWPWLSDHDWYIAGITLVIAGAFQFSDLKEKCLDECRHPAAYLMRHYRRGVSEAFSMGWGHGMFCLGCCWALMLVMFGAGIANLVWMAPLALVMLIEKAGRGGQRLVAPVGIALLALGLLVLVHPGWLPAVMAE